MNTGSRPKRLRTAKPQELPLLITFLRLFLSVPLSINLVTFLAALTSYWLRCRGLVV